MGKPPGRIKYLEDYEKTGAGGFEYTKQYYCFKLTVMQKAAYLAFMLVNAAAFIYAGLLNNGGSRVFYIVLPYAAMLLPLMFMLADVYKILTNEGKMTRKQYDKSFVQLKHMTAAAIVFSAAAFTGTAVCLFNVYSFKDLIFALCSAAILIFSSIFVYIQYKVNKTIYMH